MLNNVWLVIYIENEGENGRMLLGLWWLWEWRVHGTQTLEPPQPPVHVSPWDSTGSLLSEIQTPLSMSSNLFLIVTFVEVRRATSFV